MIQFCHGCTALPISDNVSLPDCAIASSCSPDCFTFVEIFCALQITSVSFSQKLNRSHICRTEKIRLFHSHRTRTVRSPSVIWESVLLNLPILRFMEQLVCKVITMINPALIIRIRTINLRSLLTIFLVRVNILAFCHIYSFCVPCLLSISPS